MLPKDYPQENCSIARTLEVLGDRWTLLIVRELLRGLTKFDELHASLDLARNVLADRLSRLVDEGIVEARPYQEHPMRYEYIPTSKARALRPVLVAIMEWGDAHYAPKGPPRISVHSGCGGTVHAVLRCDRCDKALLAHEVSTVAGPGQAPPRSKFVNRSNATRRFRPVRPQSTTDRPLPSKAR